MRATERLESDAIVSHLRRFGELTTSQLSVQFGVSKRGIVNRLNQLLARGQIIRKPHKSGFIWSAA